MREQAYHANVAYRYPFVDPLKCFVLNQKKYDVYVRVLNTSKKKASNVIASQYFKREDVYAVAIDFTFKKETYLDIDNYCRLYLDCDVFEKHVVIFKIRMEHLKK